MNCWIWRAMEVIGTSKNLCETSMKLLNLKTDLLIAEFIENSLLLSNRKGEIYRTMDRRRQNNNHPYYQSDRHDPIYNHGKTKYSRGQGRQTELKIVVEQPQQQRQQHRQHQRQQQPNKSGISKEERNANCLVILQNLQNQLSSLNGTIVKLTSMIQESDKCECQQQTPSTSLSTIAEMVAKELVKIGAQDVTNKLARTNLQEKQD